MYDNMRLEHWQYVLNNEVRLQFYNSICCRVIFCPRSIFDLFYMDILSCTYTEFIRKFPYREVGMNYYFNERSLTNG